MHHFNETGLTAILRKAGVLPRGKVVGVGTEHLLRTPVSILTRLTLQYDADAPGAVPGSLVLKCPLPEPGSGTPAYARQEIRFYRELAKRVTKLPIPRCYAADPGMKTGKPWLLLEDLSASHRHEEWPLPLPDQHMKAAVEALAALHAGQWQDAPRFAATLGKLPIERTFGAKLDAMRRRYRKFAGQRGDLLDASRREAYESIFANGNRPWRCLLRREGLTLIHGDAHCGNFLYPRTPVAPGAVGAADSSSAAGARGTTSVYLIDWQFWTVDVGARDLAYLMALQWDRPQRTRLERPLLEHYHRRLREFGASHQSWDEFWNEYRYCVIRNLLVPHMLWERGLPEDRWRPLLECAFAAFEDLNCAELLAGLARSP